jgi:hypothetical protein
MLMAGSTDGRGRSIGQAVYHFTSGVNEERRPKARRPALLTPGKVAPEPGEFLPWRVTSFDDLVGALDEPTHPGDPPTSLVP